MKTKNYRKGALWQRAEETIKHLEKCQVCPRNCDVNRIENQTSTCKSGRYALVGSYFPHFGKEDCLCDWNGSGTIFFSMCHLKCVFYQNFDISQESERREAGLKRLIQRQVFFVSISVNQISLFLDRN